MYFKDDYHKQLANKLMKAFGYGSLQDDKCCGSFSYLAAATYKEDVLLESISSNRLLNYKVLMTSMTVFSSSEQAMLRFSAQLYNSSIDSITLEDTLRHLDEGNKRVLSDALRFRYNI